MEKQRYQELDALRGIAALLVLFFHFSIWRPEAQLGLNLGNTGVHLFFIISGFVIFMSINKIKRGIEFIISRISRLYPAYWAALTITFILRFWYHNYVNSDSEGVTIIQYLGNLTMLQFYLGIPNIDDQYWTLMVEMLFYMFILLFFQFGLLKYIEIIGTVILLLVTLIANFFWNSYTESLFHYMQLLKYFPLFFAGIIFYKLLTEKHERVKKYFIIFFCLIANLLLYKPSWFIFISFNEYAGMIILYFLLFFLFVNGKLNFIVNSLTLYLGKISYSLYLIHSFISVSILMPLLIDGYHLNFWLASIGIALPITLLIASAITCFIEIPLGTKMKKKLLSNITSS